MIFVTVGTSEPFDRLLKALATMRIEEQIVVQRGASSVSLPGATTVDFLPFDDFVDLLRRARVVVMHAGVGSVLAAIAVGRRPVVVARLHAFWEAVDDHQLAFARRLDEAGLVVLVEDLAQLPDALDATVTDGRARSAVSPNPELLGEIHAYLRAHIARSEKPPARAFA